MKVVKRVILVLLILVLLTFVYSYFYHRDSLMGLLLQSKYKISGKTLDEQAMLGVRMSAYDKINSMKIVSTDPKVLGYSGMTKLISSENDIYLVYRAKVGSYYQPFITSLQINKGWVSGRSNEVAEVNSVTQRVPTVVVDSQGRVYVIWYGSFEHQTPSNRQIIFSYSDDKGMTWNMPTSIAYVGGYTNSPLWQEHPTAVVGKNDEIYVAWEGKDDQNVENSQIKFASSTDRGATWTKWKNITTDTSVSHSRPVIRVDSNGTLHLVYFGSAQNSSNTSIWYLSSSDGGSTWTAPQNLSGNNQDARHATLEIDSDNTVWVAWREAADKGTVVRVARKSTSDGKWSPLNPIKGDDSYNFFPNIAIGKSGVMVTWMGTSDSAGYPAESPEEGITYYLTIDKASSTIGSTYSIGGCSIYPHVSYDKYLDKFVVLYTSCEGNGVYQILTKVI